MACSASETPVREIASNWQQLLEQRNAALHGGAQFVVGEPDEVFKLRRNQLALVGVGELQFEFHARTGRGIRIDNVAEQAGIAQAPHCLFEIAVGGVLADLQAARGKNFFVGVARSSRDFQRDEFVGGDAELCRWWTASGLQRPTKAGTGRARAGITRFIWIASQPRPRTSKNSFASLRCP